MSTLLATVFLATYAVQTPKKPAGQKPKPPVLGQVQMAGDNGKIGTTYSLGDKGSELNFTLESAEFVLRAPMVEDYIVAKKDQKILLLTFSVANPQKNDQSFSYSSIKFTAVAPDDQNFEFNEYLYHPQRKNRFETTLKPAQKVKALAPFPIHAEGPVNKLIVRRGNGKVLRYDLRNLVKPLTGPFAKDGNIALEKATVDSKTPFGFGKADWTVDAVETLPEGVGNYKPGANDNIVGITVTIKNPGLQPIKVGWSTFRPVLTDENGETCEWTQDLLGMSSNRTVDQVVEPDGFFKARYVFRVSKGAKPAKFTLNDSAESTRSISVTLP
ncbi:DUF4352 domain-containing protein [bacterium]|nr:MAG: DUF4352 domain-containing protein [bacterium]